MLPPRRRRRPVLIGWWQAQRGDVGGGFESASLGVEGEMTEVHVDKVQFGAPRRVEPQADAFAGEGVADVIVAAFVREVAGAGDDFDLLVSGIDQRFVALAGAPGAGLVKIRRRLLVERLVRPVVIIGVTPALEAALLRGEIGRGGGWLASAFRSRCMRSCEPFSCGEAGRMNSTAMPCSIHRKLILERRPSPLEANGKPKSQRMISGRPR